MHILWKFKRLILEEGKQKLRMYNRSNGTNYRSIRRDSKKSSIWVGIFFFLSFLFQTSCTEIHHPIRALSTRSFARSPAFSVQLSLSIEFDPLPPFSPSTIRWRMNLTCYVQARTIYHFLVGKLEAG